MIFNFKNLKPKNLNAGMTYVELIVVLSIFAVMSAVVLYNYSEFQAKVDIKNLASDIASKIIEAQKSSINGVLPLAGYDPATWKPSYGVYFNTANPQQFVYFVDLNQNGTLANSDCSTSECLDEITITKGDFISGIDRCDSSNCALGSHPIGSLSITFKRPNSDAIFSDTTVTGSRYVQITIQSPKEAKALIKIYPSGRVQVN